MATAACFSAAASTSAACFRSAPVSFSQSLLVDGGRANLSLRSPAPWAASQALFSHSDALSLILLRAPLTSSWWSPGISWVVAQEEAARVEEGEGEGEEEKEEAAPSAPNTKLYFGNLPYSCGSAQLAAIVQEYGSPELVEEYGGRNLRVNFSDKPKPREPLYPETEFKLFVGNLSWTVNSESLTDVFSGYGNVVGARILYDGDTGRSRGYGFVCFSSKSEMEAALESLNGVDLEGRCMRISLALGKRS